MRTRRNEGTSIVLLGAFNPAIFQPRWLEIHNLVRPEEAGSAKSVMINNEVANLEFSWFTLQVLQDRFILLTNSPAHFNPLRDLAIGIFTLLPHTPVHAVGFNKFFDYEMPSEDTWHSLGHSLAPKETWNAILDAPGLRTVTIEGRRKNVEDSGIVKIKVESFSSEVIRFGVHIEVNEEFRVPVAKPENAAWAVDHIRNHWESILQFADLSAESIFRPVPL